MATRMVEGLGGKLYGGEAEGTWSVQLEETEGRLCCSLQLPMMRRRGGSGSELFSVVTQGTEVVSTKPDRVQAMLGQCSQAHSKIPVQG